MSRNLLLISTSLTTALVSVSPVDAKTPSKYTPHVSMYGKGGTDQSSLGVGFIAPITQDDKSVVYGDVKASKGSKGTKQIGLGVGYRHKIEEGKAIVGGYAYVDGYNTANGNTGARGTVGVEYLTQTWDARLNAYIPTKKSFKPDPTQSNKDIPLGGFDAEIGHVIPGTDAKAHIGYFQQEGEGIASTKGVRGRIDIPVHDYVTVKLETEANNQHKQSSSIGVQVSIPLGPQAKSKAKASLDHRMMESPYRDVDHLVASVQQGDPVVPTTAVSNVAPNVPPAPPASVANALVQTDTDVDSNGDGGSSNSGGPNPPKGPDGGGSSSPAPRNDVTTTPLSSTTGFRSAPNVGFVAPSAPERSETPATSPSEVEDESWFVRDLFDTAGLAPSATTDSETMRPSHAEGSTQTESQEEVAPSTDSSVTVQERPVTVEQGAQTEAQSDSLPRVDQEVTADLPLLSPMGHDIATGPDSGMPKDFGDQFDAVPASDVAVGPDPVPTTTSGTQGEPLEQHNVGTDPVKADIAEMGTDAAVIATTENGTDGVVQATASTDAAVITTSETGTDGVVQATASTDAAVIATSETGTDGVVQATASTDAAVITTSETGTDGVVQATASTDAAVITTSETGTDGVVQATASTDAAVIATSETGTDGIVQTSSGVDAPVISQADSGTDAAVIATSETGTDGLAPVAITDSGTDPVKADVAEMGTDAAVIATSETGTDGIVQTSSGVDAPVVNQADSGTDAAVIATSETGTDGVVQTSSGVDAPVVSQADSGTDAVVIATNETGTDGLAPVAITESGTDPVKADIAEMGIGTDKPEVAGADTQTEAVEKAEAEAKEKEVLARKVEEDRLAAEVQAFEDERNERKRTQQEVTNLEEQERTRRIEEAKAEVEEKARAEEAAKSEADAARKVEEDRLAAEVAVQAENDRLVQEEAARIAAKIKAEEAKARAANEKAKKEIVKNKAAEKRRAEEDGVARIAAEFDAMDQPKGKGKKASPETLSPIKGATVSTPTGLFSSFQTPVKTGTPADGIIPLDEVNSIVGMVLHTPGAKLKEKVAADLAEGNDVSPPKNPYFSPVTAEQVSDEVLADALLRKAAGNSASETQNGLPQSGHLSAQMSGTMGQASGIGMGGNSEEENPFADQGHEEPELPEFEGNPFADQGHEEPELPDFDENPFADQGHEEPELPGGYVSPTGTQVTTQSPPHSI